MSEGNDLTVGRRTFCGMLGAATITLGGPAGAKTGTWPDKPIKIVVALAPGSSTDGTARALAEHLTAKLGVPAVVENKPGGLGMIAADFVARSGADGYTLLLTLQSALAQAPVLLTNAPVNPSKDFVPIAAFSTGVAPVVARKDLPAKTFAQLVELSKRQRITVGNYSIGSSWQLMVDQLARQTGGSFEIVHYKGTAPMMLDLIAGNIDIGLGSLVGVGPAIKSGAVRPLVISTGERSEKLLPGIPTFAEEGFTGPAFDDLKDCNLLLGPAGMPKEAIQKIANVAREASTQSEPMKNLFRTLGVEQPALTGPELQAFVDKTWPTFQRLTKELGLKVN